MPRRPARRRRLEPDEVLSFDHISDHILDRVRLIRTNLIPPAADGMTLGRFVLLRDDHIERTGSTLLAHELVHVRQFAEMGAPRFFTAYIGSYLRNLRRTRSHRQAYLDIPLEQEAREIAARWRAQKSGESSDSA